MGSYLSTPILDKHTEVGCDLSDTTTPIRWAVVDMQGWRKTMEDAHVARTDVMLPGSRVDYDGGGGGGGRGSQVSNGGHAASASSSQHQHAKVFAVFDGHGGAEVARFCSIYLVPMLISRSHWRGATTEGRGGNNNSTMNGHGHNNSSMAACVAQALIDTFHELDRLIDDPNWRSEIEKWREERPPPYVPGSSGGGDIILQSPARSEKNVTVEKIDVDNDDDDDDDDSEVVDIEMEQQQCRQTIMDDSDFSTEDDEEDDDDEENDGDAADFMDHERGNGRHTISEGLDDEDIGEAMDAENGNNKNNIAFQGSKVTTAANSFSLNSMIDDESDDDELFEDSLCCEERKDGATGGLENEQSDGIVRDDEIDDGKSGNNNNDRGQFEGTVSTVVAAAASALTGKKTERSSTSGMMHLRNDTLALFQKFLRMSGTDDENNPDKNDTEKKDDDGEDSADAVSEPEPMNMNGSGNNSSSSSSATEAYNNHGRSDNDIVIPTKSQLLNPPTGIVPVSASVPTRIQNGRKICNLPDHPVHAGCTSVVSVIVGRTLVVANAGDSRAVICRAGGVAEPLSFDHKPFQNREMDRITNAGGFVNQFGRVNGNLNLSRSIGDLKYKQVPGIPPAEQMITAEPDILSTTLWPGDEFIILGCDGIWDCLSNEECVKYVRDRIDSKVPHEIGREMLDEIVSADPRASQGIGGDNMTIIIVDLLPHTRSYSKGNNC